MPLSRRTEVLVGSALYLLWLLNPFPAFGQVAVTVSPNQTNVPAGGALQFSATVTSSSNTSVTWSVVETSSGATITPAGLFTAPAYPGAYHVIATSQANTVQSATALAVVAGFLAPDLRVERSGHTATILQNGQVLLAGGQGTSGTVSSAEIYDPVANAFTPTSSMTAPRNGHAAALLPSGQVLIAGGNSPNSTTATAELYNPVLGSFTATGSMETPRVGFTATTLQTNPVQVLVVGGVNCNSGCVFTNTAELYNPGAGAFAFTGNINVQRTGHTATLLQNGQVLIAGGANVNGLALASTELYNPATGVFTLGPSMARPAKVSAPPCSRMARYCWSVAWAQTVAPTSTIPQRTPSRRPATSTCPVFLRRRLR